RYPPAKTLIVSASPEDFQNSGGAKSLFLPYSAKLESPDLVRIGRQRRGGHGAEWARGAGGRECGRLLNLAPAAKSSILLQSTADNYLQFSHRVHMLPRACRDHLIVQELAGETLVYDLDHHKAH